MILDINYL